MSATVEPPSAFDTHHDDVIHDAQVDFFGRRLATASSDRTIRIFQINQNQTETLMSILSGHEGPVWQVAWAHPKFGSILASCSYDGTVIIWQENKKSSNEPFNSSSRGLSEEKTHSLWTKLKVHRVHESSVNSISFSPHEFGLHLACASSDGRISILSLGDNGEWTSQIFNAHQTGCNCVAWCPSTVPSSLLAIDSIKKRESFPQTGPMMIASGGCDNVVKLWKFSAEQNAWMHESSLQGHTDWVRDVCWRPNLGAVKHVLVSCSQDNTVLLWRQNDQGLWLKKPLKSEPFADTIWRASFSEYGNLLAVSCGDNTVTIWREVPQSGIWEQVGTVDENVTEAVAISEPLAVEPPESAPVPDLSYGHLGASVETEFAQEPINQANCGVQEVQISEPVLSSVDENYYETPVAASQIENYGDIEVYQQVDNVYGQYEPVLEVAQFQSYEEYSGADQGESNEHYQPSTEVLENACGEPIQDQENLGYEASVQAQYEFSQYNQESQTDYHGNFYSNDENLASATNAEVFEAYQQYQYDETQYYQNGQENTEYNEYSQANVDYSTEYQNNYSQSATANEETNPASNFL